MVDVHAEQRVLQRLDGRRVLHLQGDLGRRVDPRNAADLRALAVGRVELEVQDAKARLEVTLRAALGLINALDVAGERIVRERGVRRRRLLDVDVGAINLENQVVVPANTGVRRDG